MSIYDFSQDGDTLYIVMEFLDGENLSNLLRHRNPDSRQLMGILTRVADALDYAHAQGVIQRDMKPANVMVLPDGQAKIMDFGIAQLRDTRQTASGTILGTPEYMSPERIRGNTVDGRADQFSLATIACEALAGKGPVAAGFLRPWTIFAPESSNGAAPRRIGHVHEPERIESCSFVQGP